MQAALPQAAEALFKRTRPNGTIKMVCTFAVRAAVLINYIVSPLANL